MSNIYTIYTELIIVIKLFRYYKYIRTRTPKIEYRRERGKNKNFGEEIIEKYQFLKKLCLF